MRNRTRSERLDRTPNMSPRGGTGLAPPWMAAADQHARHQRPSDQKSELRPRSRISTPIVESVGDQSACIVVNTSVVAGQFDRRAGRLCQRPIRGKLYVRLPRAPARFFSSRLASCFNQVNGVNLAPLCRIAASGSAAFTDLIGRAISRSTFTQLSRQGGGLSRQQEPERCWRWLGGDPLLALAGVIRSITEAPAVPTKCRRPGNGNRRPRRHCREAYRPSV